MTSKKAYFEVFNFYRFLPVRVWLLPLPKIFTITGKLTPLINIAVQLIVFWFAF